jgi:signal transduction histidine kinase
MEQAKITATALEAQERERNAIGVELHDNVNQIIVGTKILLSTLKDISGRDKTIIDLCIQNLQNAIDENRKIAHALVTPDLETDELVDQINKLTHSMLETAGLKVNTDSYSYQKALLDKEKQISIYRIAQEQCTNIVKYAKAQIVNISLSTSNNTFKMSIADDGVGMHDGNKTTGIGIRNINSRLSVFNGKANIITAPGKGFILEIEIPL